jgi:hypothetical protein
MAARWIPSSVVPPWMSVMSELQRQLEHLEGSLPVRPGEHPGVHHRTQRRAVGGAGQVVVDVARDHLVVELVPEPLEQVTSSSAESR